MKNLRQYAVGMTIGLASLLGGCADRPMSVPSTATLMTEGNGDRISFNPTQYGRVYISDQTDNKILYQAEVDAGQGVEVNPKDNRIVVSGRVVSDKTLQGGHQYKIYFEPMSKERVVRYREDESVK
jgi:hypothetical protein